MATPCRRPLPHPPAGGGGPPLMRKVRQRHVLWVPKIGFKINIKCSKIMTKSVYHPKCLPCITGYIQTMFLPLHFHRFFSIKTVPKRCLKMDPHFSMPRVIRVGFERGGVGAKCGFRGSRGRTIGGGREIPHACRPQGVGGLFNKFD